MEKLKLDFVLSKFTQNYNLSLLKKLKKKNKSRGNGYTNNKIIIIHIHYEMLVFVLSYVIDYANIKVNHVGRKYDD